MIPLIPTLYLGNFKAFAHTQKIPLKPLTLIYGPNSSGKSSLIHSLLLACHSLETGELDTYTTKIGGEAVDLGGFGQYVYKRDRSNRVTWGVDLNPRCLGNDLKDLLAPVQTLTLTLTLGEQDSTIAIQSLQLESDQQEILYMSRRRNNPLLRCDRLNRDHPLIVSILDASIAVNTLTELTENDRHTLAEAIDDFSLKLTAAVNHWLPAQLNHPNFDQPISSSDRLNPTLTPINPENRTPKLNEIATFWLYHRLNDLIQSIHQSVGHHLVNLRYLGPLRSYPPRHFGAARQQDPNWEAGGGFAWQTLLTNAAVRKKVNTWLGDPELMKTPYQLVLRELIPHTDLTPDLMPLIQESLQKLAVKLISHASGLGSEVQSEVERLMGDIESLSTPEQPAHTLPEIEALVSMLEDSETIAEEWTQALSNQSSERTVDLVLVDQRSQTPVSHRDVGIGISQVLPILVSCYAIKQSTLAIEQPEIHLHPRLQAELADVFLESALGTSRNTFLLETHSENLLLRIMRRMRETHSNTLPPGCLPVTPDDICILYVDPTGSSSVIQEIPLNRRGELVKAWPGGFFEEGLEEVFA